MAHFDFRVVARLGPWGALKTLYKQRTMKVGALIGTDYNGNQYFENTAEYAHGQHRWVVYSGNKSFYEVDASTVAPEWHAWLHHATAEPPTATTLGSTHRVPNQEVAAGSSAPYARSLGGVVTPNAPPNLTQVRPRGWGLGNGIGSAPNAEGAYTQPGFPTDKRNTHAAARAARAARLGFSLTDTPLTLAARASARAGVALADFARYVDDESPTKRILLLHPHATPAEVRARAEELDVTAVLPPTDPRQRSLALRLAAGVAPPTDAYDAALAAALTPAELDARHLDAGDVLAEAARYQKIVDDYKDIRHRDAAAGVARAVAKRDSLLEQVRARAEGGR